MDIATDPAPTYQELSSLDDEIDALRDEIESIEERKTVVRQRQIDKVREALGQLDRSRPATLTLAWSATLTGYVRFGTEAGFVSASPARAGGASHRFNHIEVIRVEQSAGEEG